MGRGLPDPPPEAPPEKPAEPYKPITLNGPPAPSVQPCKSYINHFKLGLQLMILFIIE